MWSPTLGHHHLWGERWLLWGGVPGNDDDDQETSGGGMPVTITIWRKNTDEVLIIFVQEVYIGMLISGRCGCDQKLEETG